MKEKLTRNIGLKILSIILAAILWLVITNVDDPITTQDFDNVPVEILNKNEITDIGEVYEITEGENIDFTVAARRSIIDDLTVSDFKVTADFSKLSEVNAVTINIYCSRYGSDVTVTEGLYQVMKVNLEQLVEKHFKVNVVQKGEPAEGYYVAEKTANTIIQVSGPKSKIESISQIVVEVDVSEVAGSFRTTEEPKALDEEGNEIDASNLKFSDSTVTVNIGMYRTKTIDLQITPTGKPAEGYVATTVEYEPKTIEVAGAEDVLDNITSLSLEENIDGANQSIEKEINIQEQMGEGLVLVGDNQTAVVDIGIEKADTKELYIQPEDIEVKNNTDNLKITFVNIVSVPTVLSGPTKKIKSIKVTDIKPYIDLSGYAAGDYEIPIGIDNSGYLSLVNAPTISVHIE